MTASTCRCAHAQLTHLGRTGPCASRHCDCPRYTSHPELTGSAAGWTRVPVGAHRGRDGAVLAPWTAGRTLPPSPTRRPRTLGTELRRALWARSSGQCELRCGQPAQHAHHRQPRAHGGQDMAANLLHICHRCHHRAHTDTARYARGWLCHSWDDPAKVPVIALGAAA
jgi:hypothetical protein